MNFEKIIKDAQRQVGELSNQIYPHLPEEVKDMLSQGFNRLMKMVGRNSLEVLSKRIHAGVDISYLHAGSGNSEKVLFLHGFSDSKYGFVPAAKELKDHYEIFVPDLPGFGESERSDRYAFNLEQYTSWMLAFMVRLKLKKVHLVGNSLGGAVAASVAHAKPDLIKSLTLVGSAGVMGEQPVGVYNDIRQGRNFFAINHEDDFNRIMGTLFYHKPELPEIMRHYMYKKFLSNKDWYDRLMNELTHGLLEAHDEDIDEKLLLNHKIKELTMPTLLIWGDTDRLFPLEIAQIFEKNIPNAKLEVFKKTGHMPQVERPGKFAKTFKAFTTVN